MIDIKNKKLIVIKLGSNILTKPDKKLDKDNLSKLISQISEIKKAGKQVVLVSSGAVTCGAEVIGITPVSIEEKQAAAAVGQVVLMERYHNLFSKKGLNIAQILLTKDGLSDVKRAKHAKNTFFKLLEEDIIPIVNENDTVAIEEIKFSDNDNLSALVSVLLDADLQIFLTDIDGLYDLDPRVNKDAKLIKRLTDISDEMIESMSESVSDASRGGMRSKVKSAKYLIDNHIDVIIANGRQDNILIDLYNGKECGTRCIGGKQNV